MEKKTAVEWLIKEIYEYEQQSGNSLTFAQMKPLLEQAKEMEKQKIQDLQTKIEDLTAENEQYERELGKIKNIKCPKCGGDSWKHNSCETEVKYCKCGASFYI